MMEEAGGRTIYNHVENNCRQRGHDSEHCDARGATDGGKMLGLLMNTYEKHTNTQICTQK